MGLVALRHVGSSWIRDQTSVSCIGRQILYHWITREAPTFHFWAVTWSDRYRRGRVDRATSSMQTCVQSFGKSSCPGWCLPFFTSRSLLAACFSPYWPACRIQWLELINTIRCLGVLCLKPLFHRNRPWGVLTPGPEVFAPQQALAEGALCKAVEHGKLGVGASKSRPNSRYMLAVWPGQVTVSEICYLIKKIIFIGV